MKLSTKAKDKYLSPVKNKDGALVGYRFTPGPTLRAQGLKPQMLKYADGSFMSHQSARAARDKILREFTPIEYSKPLVKRNDVLTLDTAFNEFIKYFEIKVRNKVRSENTLNQYKYNIKPWFEIAGHDCPIDDFSRANVQEIVDQWSLEGKSPSLIQARFRVFQALFTYLEKRTKSRDFYNPCSKVEIQTPLPRTRSASPFEINHLLKAAEQLTIDTGNQNFHNIGVAIITAIWTAQRQIEIRKCELDNQLINGDIENNQRMRLAFNQQKTNANVSIPVMPPLAEHLKGRKDGDLIVFYDQRTKKMRKFKKASFNRYYRIIRDVAVNNVLSEGKFSAKAKSSAEILKDLRFGDLRDTAITRLYQSGNTAIQIASWSGHSIKTVTDILKHYVDYQQETADEAGEKLYNYLQSKGINV